jgi:putative transposase
VRSSTALTGAFRPAPHRRQQRLSLISYKYTSRFPTDASSAQDQAVAMRNVRRHELLGRPVFLTIVCAQHRPLLRGHESVVIQALAQTRDELHAKVYAHVVMADHLHLVLGELASFSIFVLRLKLKVRRRLGNGAIWQDRFFDHIIRDEADLHRHLDYVHYNPVKHAVVDQPEAYAFSSYARYLRRGWYATGWGHAEPPSLNELDLE